jgi:hypothetical protein
VRGETRSDVHLGRRQEGTAPTPASDGRSRFLFRHVPSDIFRVDLDSFISRELSRRYYARCYQACRLGRPRSCTLDEDVAPQEACGTGRVIARGNRSVVTQQNDSFLEIGMSSSKARFQKRCRRMGAIDSRTSCGGDAYCGTMINPRRAIHNNLVSSGMLLTAWSGSVPVSVVGVERVVGLARLKDPRCGFPIRSARSCLPI